VARDDEALVDAAELGVARGASGLLAEAGEAARATPGAGRTAVLLAGSVVGER